MIELWHRLRQRGYTRRPESLFRVMRKMGLFPAEKPKKQHKPKPYTQMTRPGERVQVDVKVVPRRCIADSDLRLFQYTAIDEFTRLRFLAAYPEQSTYSSADFLRRLTEWYARRGIKVECVLRRDLSRWFSAKVTYYSKAAIVRGYSTSCYCCFLLRYLIGFIISCKLTAVRYNHDSHEVPTGYGDCCHPKRNQ